MIHAATPNFLWYGYTGPLLGSYGFDA